MPQIGRVEVEGKTIKEIARDLKVSRNTGNAARNRRNRSTRDTLGQWRRAPATEVPTWARVT